ncbi:hypothetical protein H7B90_10850 [Cohnella xylanilytica]|uniref:Uncharacterized protein n=1 Tax=Cohnella xylanilytica TaxID=557555 RepID=A0A841TUE4_9BACL|nr:hypothetical protein [Cohnella xylanilytica]MBB6691896.1 hypothetical protein [Cohnella xylanilytica]
MRRTEIVVIGLTIAVSMLFFFTAFDSSASSMKPSGYYHSEPVAKSFKRVEPKAEPLNITVGGPPILVEEQAK